MKQKLKHIKILGEMEANSENEQLFEMANIRQDLTGLPMIIWISGKMSNHGPRIKAQNNYSKKSLKDSLFSITIEDNPKITGDIGKLKQDDINTLLKFIKEHKRILLDYWYDRVGIDKVIKEFTNKMKLFEEK